MSFFEFFSNTANNNLRTHFSYHIYRCRLHSSRFQTPNVQKRIFSRISGHLIRGSLTLETALLLPMYLFFFMTLMSVMNMMRFQTDLQMNLCQAARQIAVYAPAASAIGSSSSNEVSGIAASVVADCYVNQYVLGQLDEDAMRSAGVVGSMNYIQSKALIEDYRIDLVVTYQMQPLCNLFMIPDCNMVNRATTRAWTGYDVISANATGENERMVYITETGTVYHLSRSCSHLDLSISAVSAQDLAMVHNADGQSYRTCEFCGNEEADTYFITSEGDCYHTSLSCSGLKRTVIAIPISEVGDRPACSRCGG